MTTNGVLLSRLAEPLAQAGLKRINVSLDTLNPDRFRQITRGGRLDLVLEGLEAAEAAGLTPIKLNAVVVRGQNEDEVAALAGLAYEHAWQVRFIEVMPFQGIDDVAFDFLVSTAEVMARIEERWGTLTPDPLADPVDPARPFVFPGARGSVGFISAMTDAFCATCNRMRLTADGKLRLCLLRDDEVDLLALMRSGRERRRSARRPAGRGDAEAVGPRGWHGRSLIEPGHVPNRRISRTLAIARHPKGVHTVFRGAVNQTGGRPCRSNQIAG